MTKSGFKSYAIKEELYKFLKDIFEKNKNELKKLGVNSFSAFLTYRISEKVEQQNKMKGYKQKFEKIKIISNTIILKDNLIDRTIELKINEGKIFCQYDKKQNCAHVGFLYSFPEVYEMLNK
jgi:hypothetical protein